MSKSVRVWVSGDVQNVGYRNWVKKEADKLGLHGWVRNRRSGMVEALLFGHNYDVDKMIDMMKIGPDLADVSQVEVEEAKGICPSYFEVKPEV